MEERQGCARHHGPMGLQLVMFEFFEADEDFEEQYMIGIAMIPPFKWVDGEAVNPMYDLERSPAVREYTMIFEKRGGEWEIAETRGFFRDEEE